MPKIVGSPAFIAGTTKAIALVQRRAPASMPYIKTIQTIYEQTNPNSKAATAHVPDIRVPTRYLKDTLESYAAALVHEGGHVHLYRIGKLYCGTEAERFCIGIQIEALRKMGGSKKHIAFLEQHHKQPTHHLPPEQRMRERAALQQNPGSFYSNGFLIVRNRDGTYRMG